MHRARTSFCFPCTSYTIQYVLQCFSANALYIPPTIRATTKTTIQRVYFRESTTTTTVLLLLLLPATLVVVVARFTIFVCPWSDWPSTRLYAPSCIRCIYVQSSLSLSLDSSSSGILPRQAIFLLGYETHLSLSLERECNQHTHTFAILHLRIKS